MNTTYRQKFANWAKSYEGKSIKEWIYNDQLTLCPSCMKSFPINKLEIHHTIPVKKLEREENIRLLTDKSNLVLLCRSCNAKQGAKLDKRFD